MTQTTRHRIPDLDVVRGFALAGLPLVNLALTFGEDHYPRPDAISSFLHDNLVLHRFVLIFTLLFGVSFALILQSASERASRPRGVLARRLAALFAIGTVQLFALDENLQLVVYAVLGLVVLLPLSYLPRRAELLVGLGVLAGSVAIIEQDPQAVGYGLKIVLTSVGLLALGSAAVRYGIHTDLANRARQLHIAFLVAAALAVTTLVLRPNTASVPGSVLADIRLFSTSAVYVTGLLLALRTGIGARLTTVLAPLGRMALTCFLTQAAAAVVFAALVDVRGWNYAALTFAGTAVLVAAQATACARWLRRFRYGPAEWLWRCATWLRLVPIRRTSVAA
ncbi:DUF418 domain-containing protein [Streptomyces sp. S.PB5]|uniref:DUF418 domain-containing protein n=1 Tax=Streptomyces sp. S.PB5 TaxID=3020844 RepID=UPI0025B23DC9|nr:DUF418 domain-containing protein [Streptomyces sp. S.PB5]MDN3028320.1 DUF418 domain-containing protein [Streptomyces sp. S.PB5]